MTIEVKRDTFFNAPYYNDYDEVNQFYQMLFRPRFSVQTRELNQLQTILQKQIERFGSHVFKDGSMVIPGGVAYDLFEYYIKVPSTAVGGSTMVEEDWVGYNISNGDINAKVTALVKNPLWDDLDASTQFMYMYIKYNKTGTFSKYFVAGNTVSVSDSSAPSFGRSAIIFSSVVSNPVGVGSSASIAEGVYYHRGFFVKVYAQKIYIDHENSQPSYRVGLKMTHEIVTERDDASLTSNASGYANYAAPGAHRLRINPQLIKIPLGVDEDPSSPVSESESDPDFVEILVVKDGILYKQITSSQYSVIADTLARRTYDESGDYTVRPFLLDIKEWANETGNSKDGAFFRYMYVGSFSPSIPSGYSLEGRRLVQGSVSATIESYNQSTGKIAFTDISGGTGEFTTGNVSVSIEAGLYTASILTSAGKPRIYGQKSTSNSAPDSFDFEPLIALGIDVGKAYVKGYEIEKVAKTYLPLPKARTSNTMLNSSVNTEVGNYIIVDHVFGYVHPQYGNLVDLYDTYFTTGDPGIINVSHKIGSARIRSMEYITGNVSLGDASNGGACYKLYLYDISVVSGRKFEQVKYIHQPTPMFSCHAFAELFEMDGGITVNAAGTTITGSGSRFRRDLVQNDVVVVYPDNPSLRVEFRVDSVLSDIQASVTAINGTPVENQTPIRYFSEFVPLKFPQSNSLVFHAPHTSPHSFSGAIFNVDKCFPNVAVAASASSFVISLSSGTFQSSDPNDYILVDRATNEYLVATNVVLDVSKTSATIYLAPDALDRTVAVTTNVRITPNFRLKNSVIFEETLNSGYDLSTITLSNTDIIEIVDVIDISGGASIKSRYILDNGQRDNYYDYGRITRKPGVSAPSGPIKVSYRYYERSQSASDSINYFCSSSYGTSEFENIGEYVSASSGFTYNLRDAIDFRPDITELTTGGVYSPKPGYGFSANYSYYLNRIDLLWVDTKGTFHLLSGSPAVEPVKPETPKDGMPLYYLFVGAYTFNAKSVVPEYIENKRYTMRDIGKLEDRISKLEYYSLLSLLEKDTSSMIIPDANGLDRYKNGFIVDPCSDYKVCDILNPDHTCRVDPDTRTFRPDFITFNINLVEDSGSNGVVNVGDQIMLDYTESVMIDQPYATTTENVNPFNIFTFVGYLKLDPPFDEWKDTKTLPDPQVISDPALGNYESLKKYNDTFNGEHWNSWNTEWTGSKYEKKDYVAWNGRASAYQLGIQWPMYYFDQSGIPITPETEKAGILTPPGIRYADYPMRVPSAKNPGPSANTSNERWMDAVTQTLTTTAKGKKTDISEKIVQVQMGDKVVSTDVAPWIRPRMVRLTAARMKPNTTVYAFFDNVDVTKFCYQETISITRGPSTSPFPTPIPNPALRHPYSDKDPLSKPFDTLSSSAEVIDYPRFGYLKTDEAGNLEAWFCIPENTFKTGKRTLRITDQQDNSTDTITRAETTYLATGMIETRQGTVLSLRNAEVTTTDLMKSDDVSFTTQYLQEKVNAVCWADPIAQTIQIKSDGGCFATSVDIYFKSVDPNIPIELQIREVASGIPGDGAKIVPGSRVIKSGLTSLNTSDDASVKTTFTFDYPIYLMDLTEYAIVMISDSNLYEVYVADKTTPVGDTVAPARNVIITPSSKAGELLQIEPYLGSFFKSQNGSTWTPTQEMDLKFTIKKAQFFVAGAENSAVGEFRVKSDPDEDIYVQKIEIDPIYIVNGSKRLRVYHKSHGFKGDEFVKIRGIQGLQEKVDVGGTMQYPYVYQIEGRVQLNDPSEQDIDSYTLISGTQNSFGYYLAGTTTSDAFRGRLGGSEVYAVQSYRGNTAQLFAGEIVYPGTQTHYDGYFTDAENGLISANVVSLTPYNNVDLPREAVVKSPLNVIGENGKFKAGLSLQTTNPNLSPVIDIKRLSLLMVSNRVNTPSFSFNDPDLDSVEIVSGNVQIGFEEVINKITIFCGSDSDLATRYSSLFYIGKYISCSSNDLGLPSENEGPFSITKNVMYYSDTYSQWVVELTVDSDLSLYLIANTFVSSIVQHDRYVTEIGPQFSSSASKYITKRVNLLNESTAIRVMFGAYKPANSEILVYYKLLKTHETREFDSIEYKKADPDKVVGASINKTDMKDHIFTINGIDPFISVAVKVVFQGTDTSNVPFFEDFRVIALDV